MEEKIAKKPASKKTVEKQEVETVEVKHEEAAITKKEIPVNKKSKVAIVY